MNTLKNIFFWSFKRYYSQTAEFVRKVKKVSKSQLIWYPGHINKGIERLNQKIGEADAVVEVHDCRIPLTGRVELLNSFGQVKPKILVLNKTDLIRREDMVAIERKLKADQCMNDEANMSIVFAQLNNQKGQWKLFETIHDILLNQFDAISGTKGENHILVTGIPNVGKSTFINKLRLWNIEKFGYNKTRSKRPVSVGPHAGVTRVVSEKILINEGPPRIYILDSPGIWEPPNQHLEAVLKMALCGCFNFDSVHREVVIDYMLYWLNRKGYLDYVNWYGLDQTTDDVIDFVIKVCYSRGFVVKANKAIFGQKYAPNINVAFNQIFLDFNQGSLGKFILDDFNEDNSPQSSSKYRNINSVPLGTIFSHMTPSKKQFPFVWGAE